MIKNKTVIYTAIFGEKDGLIEPRYVSGDCDYVCFTDADFESKIWKIIRCESIIKNDPVRSAKIYKILPHKYFPVYEYSVWVDGNLLLRGDVFELIKKYLQNANMAVFNHANYKWNPGLNKLQRILNIFRREYPFVRHCIYEEAAELVKMASNGFYKDNPEIIKKQIEKYKKEGYPEKNEMLQGSVLVRRHNAADVVRAMECWWQEIKTYSRRDQLSFNYVAWKNDFNFVYMKGDPRKNKYVFRLPHAIKKN